MRSAAVLLLLAAGGDGAIEREWWIRAVARAPAAHVAELEAELAAEPWRRRASALDALARAAEGATLPAELAARVTAALRDAHPSVRARALAALAAAELALDEPDAARLAEDLLPAIRLELARALEFAPSPGRAGRLAGLAFDADARVREAARNALCGLEPDEAGVGPARLAVFQRVARDEDAAALARFTTRLAEAPLDAEWVAELRRAAADLSRLARGAAESVGLARFGAGDSATVIAAWSDVPPDALEVARLLQRSARSGDPLLARAALARLAEVELEGTMQRELMALVLDALGDGACAFLARESPSDELLAELLPELLPELIVELGLRRDAWNEDECARWTDPETPEPVRHALLQAVAAGYTRSAPESNARLLARFLDDPSPELAARAFTVLSSSRAPSPTTDEALWRAWERLGEDERVARLSAFSRERPFPSFAAAWIELGEHASARRPALCELLAGFEGDARVSAALERWLLQDLALLPRGPPVERALEHRLQAELRALARVAGAAAIDELARALELALGRSTEIGKVAAAALGRTPGGCRHLAERLAAGAFASASDRRTRIEACIVLARSAVLEARAPAARQLLADRPGAAWDLRQRMLQALAEAETESVAALAELAAHADTDPVERVLLVTLLAELEGAEARAALRECARVAPDLEARSVALRELGRLDDRAGLCAAFAELAHPPRATELEDHALLRGEALSALARLTDRPAFLCAEWLRAPLESAAADLARRQAGLNLAAASFAWRHELEAARHLAARGLAPDELAAAGPWERVDGDALVALAEALEEGGAADAADAFFRAGIVALAGQHEADEGRIAWARARRLGLAWRQGRFESAAWLARRVLSMRRDGALSDPRGAQLFGSFERGNGLDPGLDPDARLRALRWQAEAWATLAAGEGEHAWLAAARAARECGASRLAGEVQRELERALADVPRPAR